MNVVFPTDTEPSKTTLASTSFPAPESMNPEREEESRTVLERRTLVRRLPFDCEVGTVEECFSGCEWVEEAE